ncbi:hypothetical protein SLS63_006093 [Diaporthe eres]|uniref:Uncharacterized protein n=1 Tax=Diaporthe eres TaxID=83184 RepID=A0ABR1P916_DIAER
MANWPRPRRSRQPHRELNNFQQAVDERRRVDVGAHEPFVEELEDDDVEYRFPPDYGETWLGANGAESIEQRINRIIPTLELLDEMRTIALHRERRAAHKAHHPVPQGGSNPVEAPATGRPAPVDGPSSEVGDPAQAADTRALGPSYRSTTNVSREAHSLGQRGAQPWVREAHSLGQRGHSRGSETRTAAGQRGAQPWVREEGVRRQWDEGPQHPVSMLERAGTVGRDGQPSLFQMRGNGEVRIRTEYWASMTARQKRRWNERGRFQFRDPETGRPPANIQEAIANHQSFIDRRDFCLAQAERMQRRMNGSNLRSLGNGRRGNGRLAVKTYNVPR